MTPPASPPQPVTAAGPHLGQLPGLDGLRAIAAVSVFCYHSLWRTPALQPVGRVLGHGDVGVEIFFVMSGFLVARPVVAHVVRGAKPVAFVDFWRKRIARIWPAYLVALAGAIAVGVGEVHGLGGWLKHGLLVQTQFGDRGGTGLKVSWTLVVEVAFYVVLLPLGWVAAKARRRPDDAWATLCLTLFAVGALALAVTSIGPTPTVLRVLPPFLPCFSAGMLLAGVEAESERATWSRLLFRSVRRLASRPLVCFGLAITVFVTMTVLLPASQTAPALGLSGQRAVQSFGQVAVAFLALTPLALRTTSAPWLEQRALVALGSVSFGFYLWHIQVLRLARPMLQGSTVVVLGGLVVAFVGAYAAGEVSRRLIEEPARRALTRPRRR